MALRLSRSGVVVAPSSDFTTSFPLTENPISQGGIWTNGLAVGLDWTDPKTTGGKAVASAVPTPTRYSDDLGHLKTSYRPFNAKQFAQGTVYLAPGYTGNGGSHEIELLLHFNISANVAQGYEILFGLAGYYAVVRWNGPVTNYTALYDPGAASLPVPVDGDVFRAEIDANNDIRVFRNGSLLASSPTNFATNTTYLTGQPGMGFWPVDGAIPENFGWKNFTAGDL